MRKPVSAAVVAIGLLALLSQGTVGKRFMQTSPGRRKLTQGGIYGRLFPAQDACPAEAYISNRTTPDAIFDQLTPEEYLSVAQYLVSRFDFQFAASLDPEDAYVDPPELKPVGYYNNTIYNIFLMPPSKAAALAYLDEGGPAPSRFAEAIVIRGAIAKPDTMSYKVGPLPVSRATTAVPLYQDEQIPWFKRPFGDKGERRAWRALMHETNVLLTPLFLAVVGQCMDADNPVCDDNMIDQWPQPNWLREAEGPGQRINMWFHWLTVPSGGSSAQLFPIPIYYKTNLTDPDPANWVNFDFEHCGQGFSTAQELIAALNASTLRVCNASVWTSEGYNSLWSDAAPLGPARPGSGTPGPRLYEPAGKRFQLKNGASPTSRSFSWLGWEGHVTSEPWRGLQLHNIKYKGERILYELAWQDQFVDYSGFQTLGQTYDFDGTYQLGGSQYTLRPGYDCPETATYMDVNVMGEYGQMLLYKGGVCFFEANTDSTTWRHFDYDDANDDEARVRGVRNYEFVIRSIATIGNYDYIADVRFQLDGAITVRVFMAGFMQNEYFDDQYGLTQPDLKFGTRIQQKVLGNIHDHLTSWKVDLDINGTANSFHRTVVRTGTDAQISGGTPTPSYSSSLFPWKYLDDELVQQEQGWKLNFLEPAIFTITNDAVRSRWNNSRAYGIFHQYTAPQLLPDNHPLLRAAAWTKYNVAISRAKDNESFAVADYFDTHGPQDPIVSLDFMLDGESIIEQDLVAWVSMGIIHVPRQEDLPLITNVGSEFQLKPVNFFLRLDSLDIAESDQFAPCLPQQGNGLFNYTYAGTLGNAQFDFSEWTIAGTLPQPQTYASQQDDRP